MELGSSNDIDDKTTSSTSIINQQNIKIQIIQTMMLMNYHCGRKTTNTIQDFYIKFSFDRNLTSSGTEKNVAEFLA
ncbi:hypothetical protein BpHYR1_051186 [Brachionus plicatilis]|uniref:Uncharacterized protein n=1 Tax=Brachionus plicatilis TaxID=10195 RepID=A0A3M7QQK9_BRAPC|nr:hypothetical protein BpHYR1_051186 [Brachionus plicatilis]